MTGHAGGPILLDVAGARLEAALADGDAVDVMRCAAELERHVRELGAASHEDPTLRPALHRSAALVVRVLERLADAQEAALAARIRDRRVQAAYGAAL